jgi:hypothetical protein
MSCYRISAVVVALLCSAVPAAAQSVRVQFANGRVTVSAQNAPVRQILAEWARLGGTTFVNADRVPGAPVTLELENVTEREALDVLLRSVSGYMVAAREAAGGPSSFDRILIVPTSNAPRPSSSAAFVPQPMVMPLPQVDIDPNDPEENPPNDVPPQDGPNPRGVRVPPTPRDFVPPTNAGRPMPPQPFQPDPDDGPDGEQNPPAAPNNPFGVQPGSARPGVITPVPQQQPQNRPPQPDPEP